MQTNQSNKAVAKLVMQFIPSVGYIGLMFGPRHVSSRIEIMSLIHGKQMPKSKCGIHAMLDSLYQIFPVTDYTCRAGRERKLEELISEAAGI